MVALFMDGVVVAQQMVIVGLGITRDGSKVSRGLLMGSTENAVEFYEIGASPLIANSVCGWPLLSRGFLRMCRFRAFIRRSDPIRNDGSP